MVENPQWVLELRWFRQRSRRNIKGRVGRSRRRRNAVELHPTIFESLGYRTAAVRKKGPRVLLLGLGDLGCRIAQLLAEYPLAAQLRLAGRSPMAVQWAKLLNLDLHAKKKKLLRSADAEFLAGQTPDLPKLQLQLRELKIDDIELETGRPRTEAYIVYLFLMLRGFNGGCKDQHARLLLQESITLRLWLEHLGLELPPASTLSDNLNAVSNQTRSLIHQVQMRYILQQGLDDFQKCFIDSTAVEANTERPTDSTILVRLIARVCTTGANLHRWDNGNTRFASPFGSHGIPECSATNRRERVRNPDWL